MCKSVEHEGLPFTQRYTFPSMTHRTPFFFVNAHHLLHQANKENTGFFVRVKWQGCFAFDLQQVSNSIRDTNFEILHLTETTHLRIYSQPNVQQK